MNAFGANIFEENPSQGLSPESHDKRTVMAPAAGNDTSNGTRVDQSAWIRYSIEWRESSNKLKGRQEDSEEEACLYSLHGGRHPQRNTPAFERISVFHTVSSKDPEADQELMPKAVTEDDDLPLGLNPTYMLRIYSAAIIHALRSVVRYYPDQDLSGDTINVKWPYPILVHHYEKLRDFQEVCSQKTGELCIRERDVVEHIKLLLRFLDKEVMESVNAEKERNKLGRYTFDYFWVAIPPGTTILHKAWNHREWRPSVIHSVSAGIYSQPRRDWNIKLWSLMYDGTYLGRVEDSLEWGQHDGEASYATSMLHIFGSEDFPKKRPEGHEYSATIQERIDYGKIYWTLLSKQAKHHSGTTMEFPYTEVRN
jgi:hypothetical protein